MADERIPHWLLQWFILCAQGTNGSQIWDTSFAIQALLEVRGCVSLFLSLQLIFLCPSPMPNLNTTPVDPDSLLSWALRPLVMVLLKLGFAQQLWVVGLLGGFWTREAGEAVPRDMAVGIVSGSCKTQTASLGHFEKSTEQVLERKGSVFLFW